MSALFYFKKILCLLCNSNTLQNISMVLGRNVEQDETTCHVQEWQLCLSYLGRYLPLLYLIVIIHRLAHLSTVSYCGQSMSVVHRAASTIALKAYSSYNPGPIDLIIVGSIGVTCRSKIAKIVLIGNPRWPPSWKSIFRFLSWTKRPVDYKLARKHRGDL